MENGARLYREDAYKKMYEIIRRTSTKAQVPLSFRYPLYIFSGFQDRRVISLTAISKLSGRDFFEIAFYSFFGDLPDAQTSSYWDCMARQYSAEIYRGKMLLAFSKSHMGLLALNKIVGLSSCLVPWHYKAQIACLRVCRRPLIKLISLMPDSMIRQIRSQRQKKRKLSSG